MKKSLVALSLIALTACGGGGGGTDEAPTIPSAQAPTIVSSGSYSQGESVEIALLSPTQAISNIQWRQTSGESVTFHAANSKVISFAAPATGDYAFEVSYTDSNGQNASLSHSFSVSGDSSLLSALLSHAVVESNKVSLRAYVDENTSFDSIKWTQTAGPQISLSGDTSAGSLDEQAAIFFDAPNVAQDMLLTFDVTMSANSESYVDTVYVLVENSSVAVDNVNSIHGSRVANVHAFNATSPYANTLVGCVYSNAWHINNSCSFSDLPLIAHDNEHPSLDDIMDRVVVSHNWMGERFQQWMEAFDEHDDFKNLLRATSAIVISYDIRPSFYHPYSGAIYLDPDDLWLTPEERDTINQAPDYRAAFGSTLQFEMPWRYTLNNESVYYFPFIEQRASRELEHTKHAFASLLYHELAHANDYFPPSRWQSISSSTTYVSYVNSQLNNIKSIQLNDVFPLGGNEMFGLAEVRFRGADASATQQSYTTEDVANFFSVEQAPQFYSYTSTREDYAILFDGFMMQARYGIMRDVGVSDQEYDNVVWGQRGREGDEQIKPRLKFTVAEILPEFSEADTLIDNLPAPIALPTGVHWRDTRVLSETARPAKQKSLAEQLLDFSSASKVRLMPIENRRFKEVTLN
ncbi:PKD domain-containing protein [Thalassotalea fusca]